MAMTINTNVASLNAQRNLSSNQTALTTSLQRLSSGLRINSAKDDAAGLAVAERIQAQVRGFNVAIRNSNDAISLMQVADGGAGQIADNIQRMRELAVQAANGTLNSGDRDNLQVEFSALGKEITRLSEATKFNNIPLLNSASSTFTFQVGAGTTANDQISVSTVDLRASGAILVDSASISINGSTASNALAAITNLDSAINTITTTRAGFGAALNRATAVISSLQISVENQAAARGRIVDADFAAETAQLSRNQILQQAGTAMLSQANALPQQVLQLLQG
ncbi:MULTISPECIES: flagellin [unclassified Uliginosibacterium]|jgi:flagellin|uniref:flagellin N-terminal helical domain-containing protein n=1 Tax=unclassified Uliginosibacterium TaxID=2621521 RepID=UPI000C7CB0C6|nr:MULTISPECIES: flagellin [unclassified Uliginosibacterium]MDO6385107.1 flagellin [Uliginosibacterium sp. 31-12]PLK48784.1 flagellin FliC [Uliginosibacterium sp. TH139]